MNIEELSENGNAFQKAADQVIATMGSGDREGLAEVFFFFLETLLIAFFFVFCFLFVSY